MKRVCHFSLFTSHSSFFTFHFSLFTLLSCLSLLTLQAAEGDWRVYASYYGAQRVATIHQRVYVQAYGGLFSYDPEDTSVETFDKAGVMSDTGIYTILPCTKTDELVVLYTNGNIDLLDANGDVYNMPDLKMKIMADKTINDALLEGGVLYISTGSGIVCVDIIHRSFNDFYSFSQGVNSMALSEGAIYAVTPAGIYRGQLDDNLLDPLSWTQLRDMALQKILVHEGNIYVTTTYNFFRITNKDRFYMQVIVRGVKINRVFEANGQLFVLADRLYLAGPDDSATSVAEADGVAHMAYAGGTYWAACGDQGLQGMKLDTAGGATLGVTVSSVIPNSPRRNFSYQLKMAPDERLLMTAGAFIYSGEPARAGTIMQYEQGTWSAFDEEGPIAEVEARNYQVVTDIVQDPLDPSHHFASAASSGLYEFRDRQFVRHYSFDNSPLQTIDPGVSRPEYYVRVTGLAYDDDHNLWMCNNQVDTVLRVLRADGSWTHYYTPALAGLPTFDHIRFDSRGWVWVNSRRSVENFRSGIFVLDTGGTLDNHADDRTRFLTTFQNQDGTEYVSNLCNCMTEDLDGTIWLGYDRGLFAIYDPTTVFDSDLRLTQIKVPRNDGSNLADYLLSEVPVSCITIDGGNRKWIGTTGSGVYLVSADGLETLAHFTTTNSPLPNDEIYDIAINGATGEVFIATDGGLVSYMGSATDPADDFDKDLVHVYPNPVRPDYAGNITVTGLMYDTNVKIVNAAGRLVNEGTSVGGSYTWNGRLSNGRRPASGIYYVLAANSDGKKGVAAKFLIVSQ